jgi:hypothetical protein
MNACFQCSLQYSQLPLAGNQTLEADSFVPKMTNPQKKLMQAAAVGY